MLNLIWYLGLRIAEWMQRNAPTNRLLNHLRKRENLRYGTLAMLLTIPYLFAGWIVIAFVEAGASDWWRLLFILALWNAAKFLVFGPASIFKLLTARRREAKAAETARTTTDDAKRGLVTR